MDMILGYDIRMQDMRRIKWKNLSSTSSNADSLARSHPIMDETFVRWNGHHPGRLS